jgi:hypothetical protein
MPSTQPLKYAYDEILEMLGGYSYYTKAQVDYVYFEVNNIEPEKKQLCLDECIDQAEFIKEKYSKLTLTNDEINDTSEGFCEQKEQ